MIYYLENTKLFTKTFKHANDNQESNSAEQQLCKKEENFESPKSSVESFKWS